MSIRTQSPYAKALSHTQSLLTDLIDQIPDVIYFKDTQGRLILVNRAHAQGLGLKPDEVAGKTDFDIFPRERAKAMARDDDYVMRKGKPIIDKIERGTRADGVDNYVTTTKVPRYDSKGTIVGLIGITRDITARMQLSRLKEEKEQILKRLRVLEEMTKMKSEFLSVVSHELNTPLIIVKEALMLVVDGIAGVINNRQKGLLLKANANLERLKRMIDDLLDMSRIEKHKLVLHYSLVNFNDLLLGSSEFFTKWAKEKAVKLSYRLPPEEINIFIDPERISQVISNLINNAIKFTEQNGQITVQVDALETKIRVGVFDSGVGISAHDLPRLFRKFSQLGPLASPRKKGVGLGLSISKELIEKHGGEIWVESKPGVGSKFYFTLPRFYTAGPLDSGVRERINKLLDKRISIYLINVLIVNFRTFQRRILVSPRKLFHDLRLIIDRTAQQFSQPDKEQPQVVLEEYQRGEWSILFPETKEGEAVAICEVLKNRIEKYFAQHKLRGVFINLGIMSYFQKDHDPTTKHMLTNLHVKRIAIGSEVRKHRRISYRANIDIVFPDNRVQSSRGIDISRGGLALAMERMFPETVDISAQGLSFKADEQFKTDALVEIVLKPSQTQTRASASTRLCLKGRVVWVKTIEEETPDAPRHYYKVGIEFVKLSQEKRSQLVRFIQSLPQTPAYGESGRK